MTIKIHHATATKATKNDVELVAGEDTVTAEYGDDIYNHVDPKIALTAALLQRTFKLEWPGLDLDQVDDDLFQVYCGEAVVYDGNNVPVLAEVLEACQEKDLDPSGGIEDDEEEQERGGVVPIKYKIAYAEAGHPDHCGDWLAQTLEGEFEEQIDDKGTMGFSDKAFTMCLQANGVEMVGKWASLPEARGQGWQGRYRMNGRQKLEVRVAIQGYLSLHGNKAVPPQDELAFLQTKHAKAIAKIAKAAEEAKAAEKSE